MQQLMRNLAALGLTKSLLKRDDIAEKIVEAHQRLTDCLGLFNVSENSSPVW